MYAFILSLRPLLSLVPPPFFHTLARSQTLFDMASITKVLTTTTAVAQLYQNGDLDLGESPLSFPPFYLMHLCCSPDWCSSPPSSDAARLEAQRQSPLWLRLR